MAKKGLNQAAKANPEEGSQPERRIVLTVKDRLLFGDFFPERSNLVNQMIVDDISSKIKIDREERERIGLKPGGQGVVWDEKKAQDITVQLTGVEVDFLKQQVARIDKAEAFTADTAHIAKKIKDL